MERSEIIRNVDQIRVDVQSIADANLKQGFGTLLNLVEHLTEENQGLRDENQRLRDEITRLKGESKLPPAPRRKANKDVSSEKERKKREPKPSQNQVSRRTFEDLQVHDERICPVSREQRHRQHIEEAAAIVAYHHQQDIPVVKVLVCDDAGQFKVLTDELALCWIHAGRHYQKLDPVVPLHQEYLDAFRERYWDYYGQLVEYRQSPSAKRADELAAEFDELFSTVTGYDLLDARIAKTRAKKDQLLTVLSYPEVPLHNNQSELGARVSARRRDVSLHTRSQAGTRAMDTFTTIVQTAKKLCVNVYAYIFDRISGRLQLPSLAELMETRSHGLPRMCPT